MAKNPFDQFDGASNANPFDQFDAPNSDPVKPVNLPKLKADLKSLTVNPKALADARAALAKGDQTTQALANRVPLIHAPGQKNPNISTQDAQRQNDQSAAKMQGLSFDFGDEIGAGINAAKTGALNLIGRGPGYSAGDAYAATQAADRERRVGYQQEHPWEYLRNEVVGSAMNPLTYAGGGFVTGGKLAGSGALGGALRSGLVAGGQGALYGAGSGEGFADRAKQAAEQAALSATVGGALHLGGSGLQVATDAARAARAARANANPLPEIVDTFDRAQIDPSLAVTGEGKARLTKTISENPLVGGQVRDRNAGVLEQAATSADNRAAAFGTATGSHGAGDVVQGGVKDFNERFSERAGKLYDNAFEPINMAEQKAVDKARSAAEAANQTAQADHAAQLEDISKREAAWQSEVQRRAQVRSAQGAATVTPETVPAFDRPTSPVAVTARPVVFPTETTATLRALSSRANAPTLSSMITDPRYAKLASALSTDAPDVRFGDLRELRTWVRNAQKDPVLRQGIATADLNKLESSLTSDIYSNAQRLAGPDGVRRLQQADQFYRLGSQRIQGQLQRFVGNTANPVASERAFDQVWAAAKEGGGANIDRLTALKKSLKPQEWGDVAASSIQRMGKAKPGVDGDFSVSTFATNYKSLSPEAKDLLFGAGERRDSLEALASATERLRNVEKMANHSNSAASGQAIGTYGALGAAILGLIQGHPAGLAATGAGLGAMRVSGEMLTNPAFARWLAKGVRAARGSPGVQRAWVADLAKAASKDAKLQPLYGELRAQLTQPPAGQEQPSAP